MPGKTPSDDVSPLQPEPAGAEHRGVVTADASGVDEGDQGHSRDLQLMALLAELVR